MLPLLGLVTCSYKAMVLSRAVLCLCFRTMRTMGGRFFSGVGSLLLYLHRQAAAARGRMELLQHSSTLSSRATACVASVIGTMPGRELLQNGGPTAGFYGEDPVGEYGQYGTESGADAGTEAVTERGLSQFGPKDTTDLKPLFEKYDFSAVVGADITYYDKMGAIGQCTQTWVPPGFSTVALAAPTFNSGLEAGTWCGTCVRACFNDLGLGQGERCFDAIIDNVCPECDAGDLDLAESGDGRWLVAWTLIKCPERDAPLATTQGSNPYYAKIKVEGGPGSLAQVNCFDVDSNFWAAELTSDGFWEIDPVGGAPEGAFRCGAQCSAVYTCCEEVDVVTLFPEQFGSDGDGCPDSLDFITDV